MAVAIFILPMVQVGNNPQGFPHYGPKYVEGAAAVQAFGVLRFSRLSEALCLVQAPQAALDTLAGQSDVIRVATSNNVDTPIDQAQRDNIRAFMEARDIPAQWVNTGDTRRQVIRGAAGVFLFSQRVEGRTGQGIKESFADAGIALSDTWADLPQGAKNVLRETSDSFGWPDPGFNSSTTVREILKYFSDQWENEPIIIAGFEV